MRQNRNQGCELYPGSQEAVSRRQGRSAVSKAAERSDKMTRNMEVFSDDDKSGFNGAVKMTLHLRECEMER